MFTFYRFFLSSVLFLCLGQPIALGTESNDLSFDPYSPILNSDSINDIPLERTFSLASSSPQPSSTQSSLPLIQDQDTHSSSPYPSYSPYYSYYPYYFYPSLPGYYSPYVPPSNVVPSSFHYRRFLDQQREASIGFVSRYPCHLCKKPFETFNEWITHRDYFCEERNPIPLNNINHQLSSNRKLSSFPIPLTQGECKAKELQEKEEKQKGKEKNNLKTKNKQAKKPKKKKQKRNKQPKTPSHVPCIRYALSPYEDIQKKDEWVIDTEGDNAIIIPPSKPIYRFKAQWLNHEAFPNKVFLFLDGFTKEQIPEWTKKINHYKKQFSHKEVILLQNWSKDQATCCAFA